MIRHTSALAALAPVTLGLALTLAPPAAQAQQRGARPAPAAPTQAPAAEQPAASNGPQRLGTFGDWTAATHTEASGKVCYAFTRMEGRNNTLLTVTHRPQGRDQVSLRIGRAFPRNAEVKVDVGDTDLNFYTSGDNAFARDGRATVAAFRNGRDATAKSPAPNNRSTTETFPLSGFTAAYEAISKECPPGSPPRR
ncbi:invasion associated locus B family protein [Pararoseomonas indoligenes]|uniref:Invasion associated locus B family protein n=1 Tax=Roseomonas indoligenes TaxID=2820811 RepID=A0A940MZC8_9PROT|nr:invasion associated locus B family protein [Pararoseomonas indoligenes]MBP0493845.1 invasion associated locus B family protein [Pararoseomonas indoligenes]